MLNVASTMATTDKPGRIRYLIVFMLFVVTTVNYADRATLSIAGAEPFRKDLGLSTVLMGYVFSAFGWAYVIGQIPGGWLLDRFGSKRVYICSIFTWSVFTFLQGFIGLLGGGDGGRRCCSRCAFWSAWRKRRPFRQRPHCRGLVPDH